MRRFALLIGLALLLIPHDAKAAANSHYLPNGNGHTQALSFDGLTGWTEIFVRSSRDRADAYELDETLFAPGLHLATSGSVYHRRLLRFELEGGLSLQQRELSGSIEGSDRLTFDEHAASVHLLGERRLSLELASRRSHSWIESPFRSSYELTTTRQAVELQGRRLAVPFTLSWAQTRRSEDFLDDDQTTDRTELRAAAHHDAGPSRADLSVRWEDYERTLQVLDFRSLGADLRHALQGSGSRPSRLRSNLRWLHQYGDLRRSDLHLGENLLLTMGESLEGGVQLDHHRQKSETPEDALGRPLQLSTGGSAHLRHRLYGSLESQLRLYGHDETSYEERVDGRTELADLQRRGVDLRLDYRRRIPWGRISIGLGHDRGREDQSSRVQRRTVSNEEHRLVDGDEPTLARRDVDPGSIVVTDLTGFAVYVEGVDYEVVAFGALTRIFRLPGGDIADGETILVDYEYDTAPEISFDTKRSRAQLRWDTRADLSLDYRYQRSEEDLVSGEANGFLEDQRRHRWGIRWAGRRIGLREEYEINRLTASEFRSNRLQLDLRGRPTRRARLQLSASHSWTRYEEIDQSLQYWMLRGRANATLGPTVHVEAESWVRIERGDDAHPQLDSELWGLRLKARKRLRLLSIEAGLFLRDADDNGVSDERRSFTLTLRREF